MGEKIFFSKNRLAREYDVSERTARVPSYFISPTMPMLENPSVWRLQVGGLVREPQSLSLDQLPRHAAHQLYREASLRGGMERDRHVARRAGIRGCRALRHVAAGALRAVRLVRLRLFKRLDLASAMHRRRFWAYGMNDNALPPTHGAPLRLYSPTKLGYKMTKYLVSLTFTAARPGGYWEDQGYPWFAGV